VAAIDFSLNSSFDSLQRWTSTVTQQAKKKKNKTI